MRPQRATQATLGSIPADAHMSAMPLFTIGYEGATQGDVIGRLRAAGVQTLVDVRAVAASRRAGFSKTILGNSLRAEGIDYLHLRALGTPKAGREAARKGRVSEMRAIFDDHLAEPEAILAYQQLKALAEQKLQCQLTGDRRTFLDSQIDFELANM